MQQQSHFPAIILASSSPYRREMLQRLDLDFEAFSPDIDESPLPGETPQVLSRRLAVEKARRIALDHPNSLVIGCDQVAVCEGRAVGKPGTVEKARRQLRSFSGKTIEFLSAICLFRGEPALEVVTVVPTRCAFRALTDEEINRYLQLDQPFDCAGSFKSECAGPSLLESMVSDDPTAIIGLPLIQLSAMLRQAGCPVP